MSDRREAIAKKIRALLAMNEANGVSKELALEYAKKAKELLDEYNFTLEEIELRESPFDKQAINHTPDMVGERLWKPATSIAALTGARHWVAKKGSIPVDTFFGYKHEVETARYLLAICERAMRQEWKVLKSPQRFGLLTGTRQRLKIIPFLDGMADELRDRIKAMVPPKPTGTGIMVLHGQLITEEMAKLGIKLEDINLRTSRDGEDEYGKGREAGKRVDLNPGITGGGSNDLRLKKTLYIGGR